MGRSNLIIVDAHSKWPEVPEQLVSDNGPQFTAADFTTFLEWSEAHSVSPIPSFLQWGS